MLMPKDIHTSQYKCTMNQVLRGRLKQVSDYYGVPQANIVREAIAREINRMIKECQPAMFREMEKLSHRRRRGRQPKDQQ